MPRTHRLVAPLRVFYKRVKEICIAFALIYFVAYAFGAPIWSPRTAVFAADQLLLTYFPLCFVCQWKLAEFWHCVDNRPRTLEQLYVSRAVLGSVLGAWLGATVVPLDWDLWPLSSHFGSLIGIVLGALSAYLRIFTNPPFARPTKRKPSVVPYQSEPFVHCEENRTPDHLVHRGCFCLYRIYFINMEAGNEAAQMPMPMPMNGAATHPDGGSSLSSLSSSLGEQLSSDEHQQQQQRCSRHFFSQEPPKLHAIIYAEFDNDIGRVVRFQVPDEIFDKQRFDTISSAIIPSEEMRDRMIKINMYDFKITGHPVGIKDKKYQREVFIFNLCFVVAASEEDDTDDSIYYEPLVQKCAEYLVELEQERCFLSEEKHRLPALMREIFDGLNQKGECVCPITDQTTIYLRLCPAFLCREPPPHPLSPFLVPIFTRLPPPISRGALNRMDVLSQKICPQIDGVRCIKDIACAVQIDTDLVGRCVRNLCFHGCVALLPQFLYSNCYVPTERLRHFFDSPQIVEKCRNFVRLRHDSPPVLFSDVARLYLGLKTGSPLGEWLLRMRPRQLHVDERKLVQFGLFYGILRKQHIYPVAIRRDDGTKIASLCDGEHSLDELALHYTCSPVELQRLLAENGNFRFITR
uniref:Nitrogen permease regulator 2-like protein n=1 Tax=Globodera rostochiensis TaxID=31243 RepID=A0A914IEF7_GLORO